MGRRQHLEPVLIAVLLLTAAVIVFGQYGFDGRLSRDTGNLLYSGQQMAKGIPPYISLFNHSGPLSPLIAGEIIAAANLLDLDDVFAVRVIFCLFGVLAVVALYRLASTLYQSGGVGMLAAVVFVGFEGFASDAVSGPRTKTPMVLFQILSLLLCSRRNWFWAGLCGSLAMLAWQPAAIYALGVIVVSVLQSERGRERKENLFRAVAGTMVPVIAVGGYFLYKRAFVEFVDATLLFNINYVERPPANLLKHIAAPVAAVYHGYALMAVPIVVGLFAVCLAYAWRLREHEGNIKRLLTNDRFAAFLLTFPATVVWSLLDFQGRPDFFPFLPYAAIGFGWAIYLALERLLEMGVVGPVGRRVAFAALCVTLLASEAGYYRKTRESGLGEQRRLARQIEDEFGPNFRFVSIGTPEILVLLRRTNPNRYGFIASGIDNKIEATEPGGFEGWLRQLEAYDPSVIGLGSTSGRFRDKLMDWLHTNYEERTLGSWTLFVKKGASLGKMRAEKPPHQ